MARDNTCNKSVEGAATLLFGRLLTAFNLSDVEVQQWCASMDLSVSLPKISAWRCGGVGIPGGVLDDFLSYLSEVDADSDLLDFFIHRLRQMDYADFTPRDLGALDEMNRLRQSEYGYTPNNLKYEIKREGTRKVFAELHNMNEHTLNGHCLPSHSKGHRNMSHQAWLTLFEKIIR